MIEAQARFGGDTLVGIALIAFDSRTVVGSLLSDNKNLAGLILVFIVFAILSIPVLLSIRWGFYLQVAVRTFQILAPALYHLRSVGVPQFVAVIVVFYCVCRIIPIFGTPLVSRKKP